MEREVGGHASGRPVLIDARRGSDSHGGDRMPVGVSLQPAVVAEHMSKLAFEETPNAPPGGKLLV